MISNKKLIKMLAGLILLMIVILLFINKQKIQSIANEPKYHEFQISGDQICLTNTQKALDLLQEKAIKQYKFVKANIGIIECAPKGSGIFVWENPTRFVVGEATYKTNTTNLYASAMVHDSCHVVQYREGRKYFGEEAEKECLDQQYSSLQAIGGTKEELEAVSSALERRYWEIPYKDRSW